MIRLSALLMPAALCAAASFALPSAADTELPVPHRVNAQLESSLDLLESLAKDGDSGAQLTLGQYLSGTAKTGADYERARKLLESAAAQGKGEAYTELARMYLEGRGVQKDTGKAVSLLESAAAKNDPEALYTIGMMRIEGKVLKKDPESGIRKAGIMATDGSIKTRVIQDVLESFGIEAVIPSDDDRAKVMSLIYDDVKTGRDPDLDKLREVRDNLTAAGAQTVILGCTELSVINRSCKLEDGYFDILEMLAGEALEACGMRVRA